MDFRHLKIVCVVFVIGLLAACESSESYRMRLSKAVVEIQVFAALADSALYSGFRDASYAEQKEKSRSLLAAANEPPLAYRQAFELAVELQAIALRFDESLNAPLPMSDLETRQLLRRRDEITRQLNTLLAATPELI